MVVQVLTKLWLVYHVVVLDSWSLLDACKIEALDLLYNSVKTWYIMTPGIIVDLVMRAVK